MHNFEQDINTGGIYEYFFTTYCSKDFEKVLDVSKEKVYQDKGIDFLVKKKGKILKLDVKGNYKDNNYITIEEYTNANPYVCSWTEKTESDLIYFMSNTKAVQVKWKSFYSWWQINKSNYDLLLNSPSERNGRTWRSAFRYCNLDDVPKEFFRIKTFYQL